MITRSSNSPLMIDRDIFAYDLTPSEGWLYIWLLKNQPVKIHYDDLSTIEDETRIEQGEILLALLMLENVGLITSDDPERDVPFTYTATSNEVPS